MAMVSRRRSRVAACALLAALLASCTPPPPAAGVELQPVRRGALDFPRTGRVETYAPPQVRSVAVMLSGDGGWPGLSDRIAGRLAAEGALVLGVDTAAYLRIVARTESREAQCHSAAADLQLLAQYAERRLRLPRYIEPVVIGYSAGATIAYLAATESSSSLRGAISLSFPPDVLGAPRPFCAPGAPAPTPIADGFLYAPGRLRAPWVAVQGADDAVVPAGPARAFASKVPGATYSEVAGMGHGFGGWGWWPSFRRSYERLSGGRPPLAIGENVSDLPLTEVPAAAGAPGDTFAVFLSGDGGWADLDQSVASKLAARGVPVVGWNSLRYFWTETPPDEAGRDLARVIESYAAEWNRPRVLLVGYSFGADVLPAMIAQLPAATHARVAGFASIAGSRKATFEFSTADWFGADDGGVPVAPALLALRPLPTLCIYGTADKGALCPALPAGAARMLPLPGGHHIGGDFGAVVDPILALRQPAVTARG